MANATQPQLLNLTGAEVNRDIEGTSSGGTFLTGRAIDWMTVCCLHRDLGLQLKGVEMIAGVKASDMVQDYLGYEGTPEEKYEQLQVYVRRVMIERVEEHSDFGNVPESDTHATIQGVECEKVTADDQPYLDLLHVGHASLDHNDLTHYVTFDDDPTTERELETCVLCGEGCVGRYWIECTNGYLAAVNNEQREKLTPSQIETLENGPGYMGCWPLGMGCAESIPKRFVRIDKDVEVFCDVKCKPLERFQNETEVVSITPVSE